MHTYAHMYMGTYDIHLYFVCICASVYEGMSPKLLINS